jgi:hypothetical protein
LSNKDFLAKRAIFLKSHVEMNAYFQDISRWTREVIEARAVVMVERVLHIWPYFGEDRGADAEDSKIQGSPRRLVFMNRAISIETWRDLLEETMNLLAERDPEQFREVVKAHPRLLNPDSSKFRASRLLKSGDHANVHFSARDMRRACLQVLDACGVDPGEWRYELDAIS